LYSGGLIRSQIALRLSILETTRAMLQQKQKSWLRRISLQYPLAGSPTACASASQLGGIDSEIAAAKDRIDDARREASRYSGGIVLSLIEAGRAQDQLTLASLEPAKVAARYGIPFVTPRDTATTPAPRPTEPVDKSHDKDAL